MKYLLLVLLLLSGCSMGRNPDHWLLGNITRLNDGRIMEFRIQKVFAGGGSATGGVMVRDHVTGDKYFGQYVGMLNGGNIYSSDRGTISSSFGNGTEFSASSSSAWTSAIANTHATLTDGKGGVILLKFQIHVGFSPHGMGVGIDNHGHNFTVMF